MTYRIRDGIVLVHIQDVYLIVSCASNWDECPYITQTNEMGAFIWGQLEKQKEIPDIVNLILEEYDSADEKTVENDVKQFIQNMANSNYLIWERNDIE